MTAGRCISQHKRLQMGWLLINLETLRHGKKARKQAQHGSCRAGRLLRITYAYYVLREACRRKRWRMPRWSIELISARSSVRHTVSLSTGLMRLQILSASNTKIGRAMVRERMGKYV